MSESADVTVPLCTDVSENQKVESLQDSHPSVSENRSHKGTQTSDDYYYLKRDGKSRRRRWMVGIGVGLTSLLIVSTAISVTILILDERSSTKTTRIAKLNYSQLYQPMLSFDIANSSAPPSGPQLAMNMISSPYSDCGSQNGVIEAYFTETCVIEGDRCRFNRYETGLLEIVFALQKPVESLTVSACGKLDIPLFNLVCLDQEVQPSDVCSSLGCPLLANRIYRFRLQQKSPTSMLNMISSWNNVKSAIEYRLKDETGALAICLEMSMILT